MIEELKHCFYINLSERIDRRLHVENQLKKINIIGTRFNACKMSNGAVGCSLSHLKCLEMARENDWDYVMIVEDDITFLNPPLLKKNLSTFFKRHDNWDVILLGGNNMYPFINIDDCCIQVKHCQTTTGYIVKKHYYSKLIENIKKGLNYLLREPEKHFYYAIDKYWLKLQKDDKWFLIVPLSVIQQPGYSNIENKNTNYTSMLTTLAR
jgi:glycosyl transferase family 25